MLTEVLEESFLSAVFAFLTRSERVRSALASETWRNWLTGCALFPPVQNAMHMAFSTELSNGHEVSHTLSHISAYATIGEMVFDMVDEEDNRAMFRSMAASCDMWRFVTSSCAELMLLDNMDAATLHFGAIDINNVD